jgi:hypothetical protein
MFRKTFAKLDEVWATLAAESKEVFDNVSGNFKEIQVGGVKARISGGDVHVSGPYRRLFVDGREVRFK